MNQYSSDYMCHAFSLLNVDEIGCPTAMHVTVCKLAHEKWYIPTQRYDKNPEVYNLTEERGRDIQGSALSNVCVYRGRFHSIVTFK